VVLRTALGLHALAVLGCRLVDVPCDGRAADEGDARDALVFEQRVHRVHAPVDELDDAVREAGLVDEFEDLLGDQRVLLTGLEDEAVPGGDSVREEPERNHPREVERRDGSEHAERPPDSRLVDVRCRVRERTGLHHRRDATGHLDVLDTPAEFTPRLVDVLAVLLDEDLREFVLIVLEQLLEREQRLDALLDGPLAPALERLLAALYGVVDVALGAVTDVAEFLVGRRVHDRLTVLSCR